MEGSGFWVQRSGLGDNINRMENHRITKFDYMHNTRLDLRGKSGRQGFRENYLVVSGVKRAAEGEI